ncbi:MAG: hypothetical protein GX601_06805 [Anaerolineales bacterium]|nr:hypothetical protein [Anaerolineales bacterium]
MPENMIFDYPDEPSIARPARKRLDDAWYQWKTFGDPPAIWRLRVRIEDGERWLQEHVQDDPQRPAALRALARFRAALAKTEASPREQQRLATWVRLETAFLAAEADYLSIVGQPAVAGRKEE